MATSLSRRVRTALFYALRTAFRLTPMPQGTRDRLRERFLDTKGHWVPEGPKGQAPMGELPRRPYVRSDERAIGYVPYEKGELPDPLPATLVAFYLPQFHTIPENDEWWGKGFTEWRNVTRALPQFEGHYQPKLPGDLGFYDLRNVEVMHEQARLAREYGISAFCFYFYWFGGKTLLETPLRNWLNDKTIDLKFCLCWANEKWTRTWDGRGDEILIDQKHSPEDDIAFIEHVAEYMRDPRYLRVDGKPILIIYRPGLFPDARATAIRWRDYCRNHGLGEICLAYVRSFDACAPSSINYDYAIQFPPNGSPAPDISAKQDLINPNFSGGVLDWRPLREQFLAQAGASNEILLGLGPGWDNEARRSGKGRIFAHSGPHRYRDWLLDLLLRKPVLGQELSRPIFVNAWNEWAEGAYLEPDARWGYAYLHATREAMKNAARSNSGQFSQMRVAVTVHAWHMPELRELSSSLRKAALGVPVFVTCLMEHYDEVLRTLVDAGIQDIEITAVDNRGRDILPFLQTASRLIELGYSWALKLHTKRSPHLANGSRWRQELTEGLLDSPNDLMAALARDTTHGLIGVGGHMLPVREFLGANTSLIRRLVTRMGGDPDEAIQLDQFPSGSMYWIRLQALRPLLDTDITSSDFSIELSQLDGTYAHAIERAIGTTCRLAGFEATCVHSLLGKPTPRQRDDVYPYAQRSS